MRREPGGKEGEKGGNKEREWEWEGSRAGEKCRMRKRRNEAL